MEDQFLPYKYAKMMKELNAEIDSGVYGEYLKDKTLETALSYDFGGGKIPAPLYQQAEEWLHDKYDFHLEAKWHTSDNSYGTYVYKGHEVICYSDEFDSVIDANRKAILKAIEYIHSQNK